jgi:phenylpropionate dioxygenase-like ring-hydroxylating dioxygenase large terminal subunit
VFEGFANVWTPVIEARRLGVRPVKVMIASEPVVLFRGAGGAIGALIDRCPHRGAALSLGRVDANGHLECPFHGWCFDVSGANRHVPLNPEARLETLRAPALPVRVIGELLWIYTAAGVSPPEPVTPHELSDPGLTRIYLTREWACHWTRAMENMLDSPHLPFVHRKTIGRTLRQRMTPTSKMEVNWEDTAYGGRARAILDSRDNGATLEFHRPNIMTLHIPIPGRRLKIHALVMSCAPGRTQLTVVGSRDFARSSLLNPLFAWLNGRIADEDKAVVESSGSAETPPLASEHSVGSDRATMQFRKYYYDTLRGSTAG